MIDRAVELPEGSTSNYYRTRIELLVAAANCQVEMDLRDLHWQVKFGEAQAGTVKANSFADKFAAVIIDWLLPSNRERTLARCELFLEATRDPVLKEIMDRSREQFLQQNYACFRAIGAKHPARAAELLVHFIFGVLYSRAVAPPGPLNRSELRILTRGTIAVLREQ
jgi:hypothetical protein